MLPSIIENNREEIERQIEDLGAELIEMNFRRAGRRAVVTFIVDKKGGITLDDCVEINKKLSAFFDEHDFLQGPYFLEVNSPGLDRPMKTEKDFARAMGERVRVTFRDVSGAVQVKVGKVASIREGSVGIEVLKDNILIHVPLDSIVKAVREIEFR